MLKFKLLYYTKYNSRLNIRVFFTYFDTIKFINNNIDKIKSMQIDRMEV